MGLSSLTCLTNLVRYYSTVDPETGLERGLGTRARELAKNPEVPQSIRRFFRAFGNAVEGGRSRATLLSSLCHMAHSIRLAKFYHH